MGRLAGGCVRAILVAAMILTPSLLLPGAGEQAADTVLVLAAFAALLTAAEYAARHPCLVEFRGAPPYNRTRFAILWITLLAGTLVCRGQEEPSELSRLLAAIGFLLGSALDVPLGPVRLLLALLPEDARPVDALLARILAGLAYLVALLGLTIFAVSVRLRGWPGERSGFNVWLNLPTFNPSAGTDVAVRLRRDGAVNLLLGFALPYATPPLAKGIAGAYDVSMLESELLLTWAIALWAFLPVSLILRGMAMRRLALMIEAQRRRVVEAGGAADPDFLPA